MEHPCPQHAGDRVEKQGDMDAESGGDESSSASKLKSAASIGTAAATPPPPSENSDYSSVYIRTDD